jgi:NAD(P)-dependent dehydrogenase (short-subunit alcohol dehydrogenase family)
MAPGLVRAPALEWSKADPELSPFPKRRRPLTDGMFDAGVVARAALFLLSPESRAIAGEMFPVDAGWRMSGV